ncbi:rRNA maturation RNase YbeY [bacterium]|nr:rRNA maturation RNase YbeY [bacterium]
MSAATTLSAQLFPTGHVALRVLDGPAIHALNREYRGVDEATDVLSFPSGDDGGFAGDLALNWEAVLKQARVNGNTPEAEAVALIAHGLLHLAGWDHQTEASARRMDARTRELCSIVKIEVKCFGH